MSVTVPPTSRKVSSLPSSPIHPLVGFGAFWAFPELTRKHTMKRGGRLFLKVPLLPPIFATAVPEDCKAIFTDRAGTMRLGEALRQMAPHEMLFGAEMIDWWNGANHAELRRKVTPAFNGSAMRGYGDAIIEAAEERIAQWPTDEPVKFSGLMQTLARDVIMSVVFGVTEPDRRRRLEEAFVDLDTIIASPELRGRYFLSMARKGKWGSFDKMTRVNDRIDAITLEEIAYRRDSPSDEPRADCLDVFLRLQQDDPENLLPDNMIAIFQRLLLIAGYETTAVTLAWVAERITRHPEVLQRLDETVAAGDDSYVDAVITETMRLRPALPVTVRHTNEDVVINGVEVPKDTIIMIYINAIQKRADLYPDPETFDPERFVNAKPNPNHWLPFGGGAHRCLGGAFAMFESRLLLRTILQHRRFMPTTAPDERMDQHKNILLMPHGGAEVTLQKR